MLQHKAYAFRLYPTREQKEQIKRTIGCARFVFNNALDHWQTTFKTTGKGLSYVACANRLPQLKQDPATSWLKDVDSTALQSALKDLSDAYQRFFKKQNQAPRFKSKRNPVQSYTSKCTNHNIVVSDTHIKLPKCGWVKYANSRHVKGRILSATVRRLATGTYRVSLLVEEDIQPLPKTGREAGVDLGLKAFATLSDGTVVPTLKAYQRTQAKLQKAQRILSRRKNQAIKTGRSLSDAKNYQKQKQTVARLHERIANQRLDFLHKVSTDWVRHYDVLALEDLDVKAMQQDKHLSRAIADASWSTLKTFLIYKAKWYGKELVFVDRYFPSSQLCHACGTKNKAVKSLTVREWTCPTCGKHHDRDLNASRNLLAEGKRLLAGA